MELRFAEVQRRLMLGHSRIGHEAVKAPFFLVNVLNRSFDAFLLRDVRLDEE